MKTSLYKFLKENGTSFYAFPGSSEDIKNKEMYFSKFVLLNLPKQNLYSAGGTQALPIHWNFDTFNTSALTQPATFGEQMIESLRNYVANNEVALRESKLNNTEYYYDSNTLETISEKVFFKWCKKLGVIDFEPAIPEDEYFSNLLEFERLNVSDDTYFPEYLWKEREINSYKTVAYYQTGTSIDYPNNLEIEFNGTTNYKVGDIIQISNVSDSSIINEIYGTGATGWADISTTILELYSAGATQGQKAVVDIVTTLNFTVETTGTSKLVYNKLIQYIGEINGVNNVVEGNRTYQQVYAHIPDHTGQTPDILFRTVVDDNYIPNLVYPIIPNQYQPEIIGAESFTSPIVSSPQNYPGGYFGQFDTEDFTYEVSNGDSLRRSGDYFGVQGDINNPVMDSTGLDGINLDFNIDHYVKMNITDRNLINFDQFNAFDVNNQSPKDFEFNAVLWYYNLKDINGNVKSNLYGISFLDNPINNEVQGEEGIKFPVIKKLVSNDVQDGTSYAFSINLNYDVNNDVVQETRNPEAINSIFSMNLFNTAMTRLATINSTFISIVSNHTDLKEEILNLKKLIYSQTDLDVINKKITNLESLIKLYSTMQLSSSDTIQVELNTETSPPLIKLNNVDPSYKSLTVIKTSDMYNTNGIIPFDINVPVNKNFAVYVENNDNVPLELSNNNKLSIIFDKDLYYKQSVDIFVYGNDISTENKKLDILFISKSLDITSTSDVIDSSNSIGIEKNIISDIDLPVFFNKNTNQPNSAKTWKNFNFNIDMTKNISLENNGYLQLQLQESNSLVSNSIKVGDTFVLNNLFVGTTSVFDFSGQYRVDSVAPNSTIILNVNSNKELIAYGNNITPLTIHSGTHSTLLSNYPDIELNKGYKFRITRVTENDLDPIQTKYHIDCENII